MTHHIALVRRVARASVNCALCSWQLVEYDAAYSPTIGGVALATYCSSRCSERGTLAPLRVVYG